MIFMKTFSYSIHRCSNYQEYKFMANAMEAAA